MISTDKIAVVILNWNGCEMMRQFLPSVVAHSADEGLIIVADNGSTDDSLTMLAQEFPSVVSLKLNENFGFAEGYNQALKQIDAPYYLLLNSDVEVTEGWLRPLLNYMESHPEVAACMPKLLSQRNKESFEYAGAAGGFIDRYGYPYCRGRIFADVETDNGQYESICPVFWATGAALMIRQTDWKNSGGLDKRFFAHMEEIDLCWRLRARGRQIVCIPESIAYHVGGGTLDAGNPRKTFLNFRNNLFMLYKNLPTDELGPVMRWRALLDGVAALKFLLAFDWANFKAVLRARREYHKARSQFKADREHNLRLAVADGKHIPERTQQSILWQYYAKGKKHFSQLDKIS